MNFETSSSLLHCTDLFYSIYSPLNNKRRREFVDDIHKALRIRYDELNIHWAINQDFKKLIESQNELTKKE